MSNKTQLQAINASLDECITRINAAKDTAAELPEAGGSSSIETWTGTIKLFSGIALDLYGHYTDGSLFSKTIPLESDEVTTITVAKNTIVFISKDFGLGNCHVTDWNNSNILYDGSDGVIVFQPTANNFYITIK